MTEDQDVSDSTWWDDSDSGYLPLIKCACGKQFMPWEFVLSRNREDSKECSGCHRKLYWSQEVRIFEVKDDG